jgi:shikimate kinase
MNLLLIGPRYAGKTTIGTALSRRCGTTLVDLDDIVLASFQLPSVRQVWTQRGEQAWREAETAALRRCLCQDGQIIALGGGVPEILEAAQQIQAARADGRAYVVYLQCPIDVLQGRMATAIGDRPALTDHEPAMELQVVLQRREPIYVQLADQIIDAAGQSAEQIAAAIDRRIGTI